MLNPWAPWVALVATILVIGLAFWLEWSRHQIFIEITLGDVTANELTYHIAKVQIQARNWLGPQRSAQVFNLDGSCDPLTGVFRLDESSVIRINSAAWAIARQLDFTNTTWAPYKFVGELVSAVEEMVDHLIITPQRILMAMEMSQFFGQTRGIIP